MNKETAAAAVHNAPPILVVDDEAIVLVALRDLLRQQGYQVVTATEVVSALNLLSQQTFAVVIADHQMPQLTGLEFLAEARRLQPDALRILTTGMLEPNTALEAINRAGVSQLLLKPWRREELLPIVQQAMERYLTLQRERQRLDDALAQNAELRRKLEKLEQQLRDTTSPK